MHHNSMVTVWLENIKTRSSPDPTSISLFSEFVLMGVAIRLTRNGKLRLPKFLTNYRNM